MGMGEIRTMESLESFSQCSRCETVPGCQAGQGNVYDADRLCLKEWAPKRRNAYWLLGIVGGFFGIHNFYRGCLGRGLCQFAISAAVVSTLLLMPDTWTWIWSIPLLTAEWLWALGEIAYCCYDASGCPMR